MQIIQDTINFHIYEPTVVTIGKFDGMHKGHEAIFNRMLKYREQGLKIVVFTFDMPVSKVLTGTGSKVLTTRVEKRILRPPLTTFVTLLIVTTLSVALS